MSDLNHELVHFAQSIVQGVEPSSQIDAYYANYSLNTAIEIYRNNYQGNLQDALAGAYPVIKQLVGDDFFHLLGKNFKEQYPSLSANLHHYGAELASFLATFQPAQELEYLSDVASLEWACHVAYFEKDEGVFDLNRLSQFSPEQYPQLIFRLHPAVRIVRSIYPISAIWEAHQPQASSNFHIDLDSGACIALVSRKADKVEVNDLSKAEAEWIQLILAGNSLGTATVTTLEQFPDFDLQNTLLKFVTLNVLIDVR
jgi:hypothetical protein